jgi:hypothetical protein
MLRGMTSSTSDVRIEKATVVVLRMYDVAYGIDLAVVEEALRHDAMAAARRFHLRRAQPKAIAFDVPPLQVGLGGVSVPVRGVAETAEATARIYDFGAIAIALRFPVADVDFAGYTASVNAVGEWASSEEAQAVWLELRGRVRRLIDPAVSQPGDSPVEEDYLLATVTQLSEPIDAQELLRRVDLAPLLSGEDADLSDAARRDLLRHTFSYYRDDLAVLTWDRAFLYEPSGDTDVADIIEMANTQLLELRYYDAKLDEELPLMNERVLHARGGLSAFARSRYRNLARELYTRVAEVTQVREKIDNALSVTEDVYLARIYAAALDLFKVRARAAGVDRKLDIIKEAYTALYDEAAGARTEILEAAIVALIVVDIILVLLMK